MRLRLDGGMIPRTVKRMFDQRGEPRLEPSGDTAVLTARGASAAVRLVNISNSGAMVAADQALHIGERIRLQLLEQGEVAGQVRWIRDGRIGIHFSAPLE